MQNSHGSLFFKPWFLDGKWTSDFRGKPHIDGSFLAQRQDYRSWNGASGDGNKTPSLVFDWKDDPLMASKGGLDIVETLSPEGIWGLIEKGKKHAKNLETEGHFAHLPLV